METIVVIFIVLVIILIMRQKSDFSEEIKGLVRQISKNTEREMNPLFKQAKETKPADKNVLIWPAIVLALALLACPPDQC